MAGLGHRDTPAGMGQGAGTYILIVSALPGLCCCNVKVGDRSTQYADIRVEVENSVFYVSRISGKGIKGGSLSGKKKMEVGGLS